MWGGGNPTTFNTFLTSPLSGCSNKWCKPQQNRFNILAKTNHALMFIWTAVGSTSIKLTDGTRPTHMPCRWFGVFYIDVDDSQAGRRNGNIIFIDPIPLGPTCRNPINSFAIPRSGLMLIFPAYLTHMVKPHKSPRDRLSFSFDFHTSYPTDPNKSSNPLAGS